jgi:predicted DNA-binding protein
MPRQASNFLRREIKLPSETNTRLQAQANSRGLPLAIYIRMLLIDHCSKVDEERELTEVAE